MKQKDLFLTTTNENKKLHPEQRIKQMAHESVKKDTVLTQHQHRFTKNSIRELGT